MLSEGERQRGGRRVGEATAEVGGWVGQCAARVGLLTCARAPREGDAPRPCAYFAPISPLGACCAHLRSPALTCAHLRSPALTCAHLRSPALLFSPRVLSCGIGTRAAHDDELTGTGAVVVAHRDQVADQIPSILRHLITHPNSIPQPRCIPSPIAPQPQATFVRYVRLRPVRV